MKPETIVIIPNFNGVAHLKECLSSVFNQSYKRFKVLLIDDFSSDKSADFVKINFPKMEIISLNENIGFTKVINLGIKYSLKKYNPKYIAFLNNDTKVDKNWLKSLVNSIKGKNIISVASNMLFYENPEVINSQGCEINFLGIGRDINYLKKIGDIRSYKKDIIASCFGASIIKTAFFLNVGYLDDRYYSYFEDIDWGWRANIFGYKIVFDKNAIVYHKGSATWNKFIIKKRYLCQRNGLCTVIKNYELKNLLKFLPLIIIYFMASSLGSLFNRKIENWKFIISEPESNFLLRLGYSITPFLAIVWNISNIFKTIKLRKFVNKNRKKEDREMLRFVQGYKILI